MIVVESRGGRVVVWEGWETLALIDDAWAEFGRFCAVLAGETGRSVATSKKMVNQEGSR